VKAFLAFFAFAWQGRRSKLISFWGSFGRKLQEVRISIGQNGHPKFPPVKPDFGSIHVVILGPGISFGFTPRNFNCSTIYKNVAFAATNKFVIQAILVITSNFGLGSELND